MSGKSFDTNSHEMVLWYLDQIGLKTAFEYYLANYTDMRYGQVFMNILPGTQYTLLSNTSHDVFFTDDPHVVFEAIEDVLTKKAKEPWWGR